MDGIIIVDKEKDYTSRDVVNIASKVLHTKKIGHTGTLDPIATGVLVLAVGKATKLVEYLTSKEKEYTAKICLGIETDTLDSTGTILKKEVVSKTKEEIDKVLEMMIGCYEQEVPKYAAVKVNGKKLYEYARNKEEVVLPKRMVTIFSLERISDIEVIDGNLYFKIKTTVSKGTYIRSLIRDIAKKLDTVGMMCELRRTKQGVFSLDQAISMKQLKEDAVTLISIKEVLKDMDTVVVDDLLEQKIKNGSLLPDLYHKNRVLFLSQEGEVLAIYKPYDKDYTLIKPDIMF